MSRQSEITWFSDWPAASPMGDDRAGRSARKKVRPMDERLNFCYQALQCYQRIQNTNPVVAVLLVVAEAPGKAQGAMFFQTHR